MKRETESGKREAAIEIRVKGERERDKEKVKCFIKGYSSCAYHKPKEKI